MEMGDWETYAAHPEMASLTHGSTTGWVVIEWKLVKKLGAKMVASAVSSIGDATHLIFQYFEEAELDDPCDAILSKISWAELPLVCSVLVPDVDDDRYSKWFKDAMSKNRSHNLPFITFSPRWWSWAGCYPTVDRQASIYDQPVRHMEISGDDAIELSFFGPVDRNVALYISLRSRGNDVTITITGGKRSSSTTFKRSDRFSEETVILLADVHFDSGCKNNLRMTSRGQLDVRWIQLLDEFGSTLKECHPALEPSKVS
jgi:hypothetical protein